MPANLNQWDVSHLIFSASESLQEVRTEIEAYMDATGNYLNITDLCACSFAIAYGSSGSERAMTDNIARRAIGDSNTTLYRLAQDSQLRSSIVRRYPFSNSTSLSYINTTARSSKLTSSMTPVLPSSFSSFASKTTPDLLSMLTPATSLSTPTPIATLFRSSDLTTMGAAYSNASFTTQASHVVDNCGDPIWMQSAVTTATATAFIHDNSTRIMNITTTFTTVIPETPGCASSLTESEGRPPAAPQPPSSNSPDQEGSSSGNEGNNQGGAPGVGGFPGETSVLPNSKVTAAVLTAVTETQAAVTLSSNSAVYDQNPPKAVPSHVTTDANNIAPDATSENPTPESTSLQADGPNAEGAISADGTAAHGGSNPQNGDSSQTSNNPNEPSSDRNADENSQSLGAIAPAASAAAADAEKSTQEQGSDGTQGDRNPSSPQTSNLPNTGLESVVGAAIQDLTSGKDSEGAQNSQAGGAGANTNDNSADGSDNDQAGDSLQIIDIGGQQVSVGPVPPPTAKGVVIAGKTVQAGQAATVNGISVSVPTGGGNLIVGGTSITAFSQAGGDPPPQILDIGGSQVTAAPASPMNVGALVVAGKTVQPGQAMTVNGVQVSVLSYGGDIVVGGSTTIAVDSAKDSGFGSLQVVNIGGSSITVAPGVVPTAVVVGTQTVQPGQVATINGVTVSIAPTGYGLVIGGTTTVDFIQNGSPIAAPTITVAGKTILANPSGAFVVAPGVTLSPGRPAVTVAGSTLSLATGGTIAIINGVSQTLAPNLDNPTPEPVLIVGDKIIIANVVGFSTAFVFGPDQTLTPGGDIVVSGTTFSLPSTGSAIIVNGETSTLGLSAPKITAAPVLTVNGKVITASIFGSSTIFTLGPGMTLTLGGAVVISGTTYSLPSTASGVVAINGQTSALGLATLAPALTINGQTIAPTISNGQTSYVLGPGTTLTPGGVITVSGTRISLDSSGIALVFGTSTSTIPMTPASAPASTTLISSTTAGPAGAIASGLGATGTHTHNGGTPGAFVDEGVLGKVVVSLVVGIFAPIWH